MDKRYQISILQNRTGYFQRSHAPYFKKTNGTGKMTIDIHPSIEFPKPEPNTWSIDVPAIGRKVPRMHRKITEAATAEAEYIVKASTKYTCSGILIGMVSNEQHFEIFELTHIS